MAALLLLLAGCGADAPTAPESIALNGAYVLILPAPPDPLSLTARALRVEDEEGRPLAYEATCEGAAIRVHLVLDASLLAAPPREVRLASAGGAAFFGLAAADGTVLPPRAASFAVRRELEDAPGGGFRLRTPSASAAPGSPDVRLAADEPWTLRLAGVVDPARLAPDAVPLFPLAGDDELPAVHPALRWRIVGGRSDLTLDLSGLPSRLRFKSRRVELRSIAGREIEPRVELLVERESGG